MHELGGFAENIDVLDGTEQTYNAFNFCLAENYLHAIIFEDWEALGDIKIDLIEQIAFWLNYDNKIEKDIEHLICQILNGSIETYKKRSFLEAIISCKKGNLARNWIESNCSEISSVDLYLTAILYGDDCNIARDNLLSYENYCKKDIQEYKKFIMDIFDAIETKYEEVAQEEKKMLLVKVKPYIHGISVPIEYRIEWNHIQEDISQKTLFKMLNKTLK